MNALAHPHPSVRRCNIITDIKQVTAGKPAMASGRDASGSLPSLPTMVTFPQLKSILRSSSPAFFCLFYCFWRVERQPAADRLAQTQVTDEGSWGMEVFVCVWRRLSSSDDASVVPRRPQRSSNKRSAAILALSALKCCRASIHAGLFLK